MKNRNVLYFVSLFIFLNLPISYSAIAMRPESIVTNDSYLSDINDSEDSLGLDEDEKNIVALVQEEIQSQLDSNQFEQKNSISRASKIAPLKAIRKALKGYRAWKKATPNYALIKEEFKAVRNRMKTEGSVENLALKKAASICVMQPDQCEGTLVKNIKSIYSASKLDQFSLKSSASISPFDLSRFFSSTAYASTLLRDLGEIDPNSCSSDIGGHLLLFGGDSCNVGFLGAGIGLYAATHVLVCITGKTGGVNVGPYASLTLGIGLGVGLLFGEDGVCQLITFAAGFDGFMGLAMTNGFGL